MPAGTTWPFYVQPLLPLQMVGTTHILTHHHILVDLNPQGQCCEIIISFRYLCLVLYWGCCIICNCNLEETRGLWSNDANLFVRWVVSFLVAGCNRDCNWTEHDVIPGEDRNTVTQKYNFCPECISSVVKTSVIHHNWNRNSVTEWHIVEYIIFNIARYRIAGGICWKRCSTKNHMWNK